MSRYTIINTIILQDMLYIKTIKDHFFMAVSSQTLDEVKRLLCRKIKTV